MSAQVVAAARQWLGTPYRHQASVMGAGCDCLGLVRGVWRSLCGEEPVKLPPYRADMRDVTHAQALVAAAEAFLIRCEGAPAAGQVVLFRLHRAAAPKHCGIMVSADRFIHAQEGIGVAEAALTESWRRRVAGVFGFPERGLTGDAVGDVVRGSPAGRGSRLSGAESTSP